MPKPGRFRWTGTIATPSILRGMPEGRAKRSVYALTGAPPTLDQRGIPGGMVFRGPGRHRRDALSP